MFNVLILQENKTVLAAHFHEQVAFYGEQVIINLVNSVTNKKKKYEGQLEDTFRKLIIDLNQVIFAKNLRKGPKKVIKSP